MITSRDDFLDGVLIGGRERVSIVVVDYEHGRPGHFDVLAEDVRRALGPRAMSVEHIGPTSVPGLAAKPIVDVLLIVDDVEDEVAFVPALEAAGFVLRVRELLRRRQDRCPAKGSLRGRRRDGTKCGGC